MNCPSCGSRYRDEEEICRKCGTLLSVSPAELERVERYRLTQNRDLLTILFVDISGFSGIANRSMSMSQKILTLHNTLVTAIVEHENAGEVVNTAGDGILAVFSNPAIATECALKMQETIAQYHEGTLPDDYRAMALQAVGFPKQPVPGEEAYQIHIGLNLGLVTRGGSTSRDIFGHHVNIACRLCTLAGKGQIYMTETVYENARLILGEREDLVWQEWKDTPIRGIAEPVTVVALAQQPLNSITSPRGGRFFLPRKSTIVKNAPIMLVSMLAIALAGVLIANSLRHTQQLNNSPSTTVQPPKAKARAKVTPSSTDGTNSPESTAKQPGENSTTPGENSLPPEIAQFNPEVMKTAESIDLSFEAEKISANLYTVNGKDGVLIAVGLSSAVGNSAMLALWVDGDGDNLFRTQSAAPYTDFLLSVATPNATNNPMNIFALVDGKLGEPLKPIEGLTGLSRSDEGWTNWLYRMPNTMLSASRRKSLNIALQYWPDGSNKAVFSYPGNQGELRSITLPE